MQFQCVCVYVDGKSKSWFFACPFITIGDGVFSCCMGSCIRVFLSLFRFVCLCFYRAIALIFEFLLCIRPSLPLICCVVAVKNNNLITGSKICVRLQSLCVCSSYFICFSCLNTAIVLIWRRKNEKRFPNESTHCAHFMHIKLNVSHFASIEIRFGGCSFAWQKFMMRSNFVASFWRSCSLFIVYAIVCT